LKRIAIEVLGSAVFSYQDIEFDFAKPFEKLTLKNAILKFNPHITENDLNDLTTATKAAEKLGVDVHDNAGLGKVQVAIFEETVEHQLLQPTFITEYPAEVSP